MTSTGRDKKRPPSKISGPKRPIYVLYMPVHGLQMIYFDKNFTTFHVKGTKNDKWDQISRDNTSAFYSPKRPKKFEKCNRKSG